MSRLLALSVLVIFTAAGCRMCACPYDYCGPVMDGGCGGGGCGGGSCGGGGGCGCGCGGGGGGPMYDGMSRAGSNGPNNSRMVYSNNYTNSPNYNAGYNNGGYANNGYNNGRYGNNNNNAYNNGYAAGMANAQMMNGGSNGNMVMNNGQMANGGPPQQPIPSYAMRPNSQQPMYSAMRQQQQQAPYQRY